MNCSNCSAVALLALIGGWWEFVGLVGLVRQVGHVERGNVRGSGTAVLGFG